MNLCLERVLRFVTVAEELSFTRAAALLRIDQPWLSRQIMQLEEQLGFALFDRTSSRIALTPAGVEFLKSAKNLSAVAEDVRRQAVEMNRRTLSALRIGASFAVSPVEWRERLLDRFAANQPRINLDYSIQRWSDDVVQEIVADKLDFGIALSPIRSSDVEYIVIDTVKVSLAIPSEDPLAQQDSVALSDLRGRRIAVGLPDRQTARYGLTYSWVDKVGATPVFVPEGRRFIFDSAEKERLFALCFMSADRLPASFVRRPLRAPYPRFDVCLIRSKRPMSRAGESFWRLGKAMSAEHDLLDLAS